MENKRYNFGFNLSALSTYTDEVGGELIRRAILEDYQGSAWHQRLSIYQLIG
jgi:hypothetical protein